MTSHVSKIIKHSQETHSTFLDLGNCGLSQVPDEIEDLTWVKEINLGTRYFDYSSRKWMATKNSSKLNSFQDKGLDILTSLPELTTLHFNKNNLSDISFISSLINIELLFLCNNNIHDISALSPLSKLFGLYINNNEISDIYALRNLTQLSFLDLANNQISNISSLGNLSQITALDLGSNQINDISILNNLSNLESLQLNGNKVNNIKTLKKLNKIHLLNLSHNEINDITVLSKLTDLKNVNLSGNLIENIKPIENLNKISYLDISQNNIKSIYSLANLINIKELRLWQNKINDISVLEKLPNLETLDLWDNKVTDFSVFKKTPKLKSLDLSYNDVTDTSFLGNLTDLTYLNIHSNNITEISSIYNLTKLTNLNISSNKISDISILRNLTSLRILHINNNNISNILPLESLTNLTILDLSKNNIETITSIKRALKIKNLNLSNNKITNINILENLVQLKTLNLWNNKIKDIAIIKKLINLEELDLGANQISNITPLTYLTCLLSLDLRNNPNLDILPLSKLTSLNSLKLGSNKISNISFLKTLIKLKDLNLNYNIISDISSLKSLIDLESLNIGHNPLNDLSALEGLNKLTTLVLEGNHVDDFSPILPIVERGIQVKISSKYWEGPGIYVEGCHFGNLPIPIIKQGNLAIVNFFRQIQEQGGTVPLHEAKLIIVGEPGAGKTSLTEKLIDENHQVVPDDKKKISTLGINIKENWSFVDTGRTSEKFISHIWDFGGQEIQYMTHQFFLTPESLYVLVADDRKQHTLFPYWFEVIHLLGKDESGNNSPILVVLNARSNKSISNFDLNEYRQKYSDTDIEAVEIDLASSDLTRFRSLRSLIQHKLCTLNHIGRLLPKMWSHIRANILEKKRTLNYINENEFTEICNSYSITEKADQKLISKYLHQLGVILHFQNDIHLRDFIVINPSWALKAVYAVLENKDVERRSGRFTDEDLNVYWGELTSTERSNILNLMKKDNFEICYPVGNQAYIAPQLLPHNRPNFDWDTRNSLKCQFRYRFMPKGIMTRLIVRKHNSFVDELHVWSRGAVFKGFSCNILVTEEETERDGRIAIEVNGPLFNRIRALDFIRNEIEEIHKKWFDGISYDELAPCNCSDCFNSPSPTFFTWTKLRQRVVQGRTTIECDNVTIKDVPVSPLLEGVYDQIRINSMLAESNIKHKHEPSNFQPERVAPFLINAFEKIEQEAIKPMSINPEQKHKSKSSFRYFIFGGVILIVFLLIAKKGSVLKFFGVEVTQGVDSLPQSKISNTPTSKVTLIGRVKINGRNANSDYIKQIYIKDQTAGPRVLLDDNLFKLRGVAIPEDRLISIAIDLKDGNSASALFSLPDADNNHVIDLGEILLQITVTSRNTNTTGKPKINIINQNVIQTNVQNN